MDNVRAMFLGFAPGKSTVDKLKLYMEPGEDGKLTPINGKLIKVPHDWPCFWTWTGVYDSFWFAFLDEEDQQRDFTSLSICVENSQCESSDANADPGSGAVLISMALYS